MTSDSTQRSRGAQPGNTNARKARLADLVNANEIELTITDFYANRLHTDEMIDLQTRRTGLLAEEINLIRVLIRRLMVHADSRDSDMKLKILQAVSSASLNLAKVIQINHNVQPTMDTDRLMRAFTENLEARQRQHAQSARTNQYHPAPEEDEQDEPLAQREEIPVLTGSIFDITHGRKSNG